MTNRAEPRTLAKQDGETSAPATLYPRDRVPAESWRVVSVAGLWEAFLYTDREGRPACVFYRGRAFRPTKHFCFRTRARRARWLRDLAQAAQAHADELVKRRAERKETMAKPHGLQVGSVMVSSWGYEQTNVDFYQVTALRGQRGATLRKLQSRREHRGGVGSMCGTAWPLVDQFCGSDELRVLIRPGDVVRLRSYSTATKAEVMGFDDAGAVLYRGHGYSEYA